jgi:signal transduction histidine kinase
MPDSEGLFLNLCENFDFDTATYFDVPVGANVPDKFKWIIGTHIPKSNFPFAEQVRDQRLVVVDDVQNDPQIDLVSKTNWEIIGTRSLVAVMFHREERLFGWLLFVRSQPHHFTEHDRRLALGIGDLAKAAVERIYLQQQTAIARQRAEILAGLTAAFSRAVNEIDLLRAFVPYAESTGAYRVEMAYAEHFRGDDEFASYLIALWMDGEYTDYRQPGYQPRHVYSHEYLLGPLWLSQPDRVMYSEDIGEDPRFEVKRRTWIKTQFNMGAALVLPLVHAGEFQGLISINWKEPHVFVEAERYIFERLLQTLPAVIATRRVYLSEQEARAENELLYTVGKDINRAKSDTDVMEAVRSCFPEPLYVAMFMWENYDRNKANYTETIISTDPGLPAGTRLSRDIFDLSDVGRTQVINDVNAPEWAEDKAAASARRFGIASVAFTNLMENQRVVGVFAIGCKTQRNFTEREIRLMSGVSELTGAALERFRLRDETERARQRAHDLAALEERTRLARELHDSVSQALYGIGLGAQTAFRSLDKNPVAVRESIEYVLTLAAAGLAEMRALIFELRPESLETEGLAIALAKQGASIQARHGIQVQIELGDEPELVLATKESLYRVAREALHNVVKHANATRVTVRMRCDDSSLQLDVIDNGVGCETNKEFPGHLGLHSMRERVMQLGGQISIESKVGEGTQLTVTMPV